MHFGDYGAGAQEADDVNRCRRAIPAATSTTGASARAPSAYYPVAVPGALLSVGDPHSSQGDSELCGTAIECSLTGTFQLILHKAPALAGTPIEGLDYPDHRDTRRMGAAGLQLAQLYGWSATLTREARSSGNPRSTFAMRDAFRKMRRFLMTAKSLTEDEAISLMSIAVDFGITQVVDGNWGVHAIVRKDIFPAIRELPHPRAHASSRKWAQP